MSQKIGFAAEDNARIYLHSQGLKWIESNYRCRWGEIDLIMRDEQSLIFVEVRSRSSFSHGGAAASITYSKRQKLLKTASHYLVNRKIRDNHPARFDVFVFEGKTAQPNWIKNAFGLDF